MKGGMLLEKWCIITVNYNLPGDTIELIHSLLAAGACLGQIVVVDNASSDNSPEQIRAVLGDEVQMVVSETNLGYAHGINLGVAYALQHGYEWLLLMNNDTLVDSNFLSAMAGAASGKPGTLFGPAIFYYENRETLWALGDYRVPGTLFGYNPFRNRPLKPGLRDPFPVDFLNGCCMLVHRGVFERVGSWDTSYYMYGEEVDFCWRARLAGFQLAAVPGAHMLHKIARSASRIGSRAVYLRVRNQNRFYRRYSTPLQILLMATLSLLRNSAYALKRVLQGEGRQAFIPLAGWLDGWFQRS